VLPGVAAEDRVRARDVAGSGAPCARSLLTLQRVECLGS
jgi:hypothetical protein